MADVPDPDPADDFWEASSLDAHRVAAWGARVQSFEPSPPMPGATVGPGALQPLAPVRDRFQRMLASRRSDRTFTDRPLSERDLARILAAVGPADEGRRTVPEAGGLDAVHAFAMCRNVAGPAGGRVVRYDHRQHAIAEVGESPDADDLARLFSLEPSPVPPAMVLVFVLDLREPTRKYGGRATRFALQQVGHASQNVLLRVAHEGLRGYALGGGLDADVLAALGLAHTGVRYGGAVAIGR